MILFPLHAPSSFHGSACTVLLTYAENEQYQRLLDRNQTNFCATQYLQDLLKTAYEGNSFLVYRLKDGEYALCEGVEGSGSGEQFTRLDFPYELVEPDNVIRDSFTVVPHKPLWARYSTRYFNEPMRRFLLTHNPSLL